MPSPAASTGSDERRRIAAVVCASSGNLVEWYDFYAYAFVSIYFAPAFFPSGDATSQLLSTAGIFAVGFFMRPVGGWLFGRLADRQGRRTSMVISVLAMSAGSLMIAVLPVHRTIGAWAPALLLVARIVQGLSVGGEYGAAATYMSEIATPGRRGFFASFQYVTLIGGQLLALLVLVVLQQWLSTSQLAAWGWRIPFFLGAVAAVVAFYLRRSLEETATEEAMRSRHAGSLRALWRHKRAVSIVFAFTAGGSLYFYAFTTYMQKYLVNTAHLDAKVASAVMTAALVLYMFVQPAFGVLSDRIGRRHSMIAFGVFATVGAAPLLFQLGGVSGPTPAFALVVVSLLVASFYTSISGLVKAELFPTEVRALGVGLTYAVANALFGGTAEYVALWLKSAGREPWFAWYVTAMAIVALGASILMPDTRTHGHLER